MIEYDENGNFICSMCRKHKKNLSLEPSRSQLIFGGFPVKLEYRCQSCENKVIKSVEKIIETNLVKYDQ
jgi:hypothetical protein